MIKKPIRALVIIFLPFSCASLSAAPVIMVKPPITSMTKRLRPARVRVAGRNNLTILPILLVLLFNPIAEFSSLKFVILVGLVLQAYLLVHLVL